MIQTVISSRASRWRSGIVTYDRTVTLCHYLLPMIETSALWTPECPHDCGQKKKESCCEMEPSSRWGNWDRKWGSEWGRGIQTQQSQDFSFFFLISHNPLLPTAAPAVKHTYTYISIPTTLPRSFSHWRWECDINQSVPITPVTPTVSPPSVFTAPSRSFPVRATAKRWPAPVARPSAGREGQRDGLTESVREKKRWWSPAWTQQCTLKNSNVIDCHSQHSKRWLPCICRRVTLMAETTNEHHNKSETAVVPSLRCFHFQVKCVGTHLTTEVHILRQKSPAT